MPESTDRGALTEAVYYILVALHRPMHGYGIMQFVRDVSKERVNLGPGTLYGAITTLLEKGWIAAVGNGADSRKKEYAITAKGRQIVRDELSRLQDLIDTGKAIIGGDGE